MKKLVLIILIFIAAKPIFAQKDAQAKIILNQVSQKYKAYNVIKSDFSVTVDNQQVGVKQTQNGTLLAQSKTNKFKITLYNAAADVDQEIISNGKKQWTYLKKDKEVQVSNANSSAGGLNPAQIFTMYEKGYKYLYTGDQRIAGKIYNVIELTPESAQNQFFKIKLTIDKVKKQIYNALIFDKNGSRYSYTIRSLTASASAADNIFTFDTKAHPGVEVIELD